MFTDDRDFEENSYRFDERNEQQSQAREEVNNVI